MRDEIRSQATAIAESVRGSPPESKFRAFYDGLRASEIPFLPAAVSDPAELFRLSFEALYILGGASVPLAVGFTMHQYMFAGLATAPSRDLISAERRRALVKNVHRMRALVAVSSFGANVSLPDVRFSIQRNDEGFLMNGLRSFQSMASEADLITIAAPIDGAGLGSFIVPLKDRPDVLIGGPVFSGPMSLTDTRSITFSNYQASAEHIVTLDPTISRDLGVYTTAWFEGLISATYLGGAAAALEELRQFAREVRAPSGEPLSSIDGTIVDAGRLGMRLKASLTLACSLGPRLACACEDREFETALGEAMLVKSFCTRNAEEIVEGARRMIGTRAMRTGSPIADLTGQIVFGPLHPVLEAEIERSIGEDVLGEAPFRDLALIELG